MVGGPSRVVTIVFTDLVGSTELAASMDAANSDALRRRHFELLDDATRSSGGEVIKNLGDGVMAAFDSAAAAVTAAVAMQQAVYGENRRDGGPALAIRVGLSAGEATNDDGDWFGHPVVEAARLCAVAEGGQVLATDVVRALVGGRAGHEFRSLGERDLKGLPAPVVVCEVDWAPLPGAATELPAPLAGHGNAFVGRVQDRAALAAAWERAAAGDRQMLLIAGEPGIGKTRLISEVAAAAHRGGGTVLYGRCYEEALIPYQPFVEALAGAGHDLTGMVPDTESAGLPNFVGALDGPHNDRYLLFEAVVGVLAELADRAPLLLAIDDLHWADKPSLMLLQYLTRSAQRLPLLVLGAYRETDLARDHPLSDMLAELRSERAYTRMVLRGLDGDELADLVADRAGHDAPHEFVAALHAETEGNPFFTEEVLIHLTESGALYQRDGRWVSDARAIDELGIPEGVREVIGRRLSRLTPSAERVLTTAAVIGREFSIRLVQQVCGLGTDETLDALEEAATRRLVAEVKGDPDRYSFTHALIRQTLYDETSTARRLRTHQQAGEALEVLHADDLEPHLSALAFHFSQLAFGGDADKALDYCRRAAQQARGLMAYEEEATHLRRAIVVLEMVNRSGSAEELELRLDLSDALSEATETTGQAREAAAAIELARELDDDHLFSRAVAAHPIAMEGAPANLIPLIEEALGRASSEPTRARLLVLLAYFQGFSAEVSEARRDATIAEAIETAHRPGAEAARPGALMLQWMEVSLSPDLEQRRANVAALDRLIGDGASWKGRFSQARHSLMLCEGDLAGLRAEATMMIEASERDHHLRSFGLRLEVVLHLLQGRIDEAEALAARCYESGRAASAGFWLNQFGLHLFAIRREQGRLAEMEQPLRALLQRVGDEPFRGPAMGAGLALLLFEENRLDEARYQIDHLVAQGLYRRRVTGAIGVANMGEVAAALGDTALCAELYDRLRPFDGQCVVVTGPAYVNGAVARYLGLLAAACGHHDVAARHYTDSMALTQRMEARPWIARTHLDWAEMLHRRGRSEDAAATRDHATSALHLAEVVGMPKVAARASALL